MIADLQAIGTFGWFPSQDVSNDVQAIGTFGWFLDLVGDGDQFDPDKIFFLLCINSMLELDLER